MTLLQEHEDQALTRGSVTGGTSPVTQTATDGFAISALSRTIASDDEILIVAVHSELTSSTVSALTWNSISLFRILRKQATTFGCVEYWCLNRYGGLTTTTANISITFNSNSGHRGIAAYTFKGADPIYPFFPVMGTAADSGTSASLDVPLQGSGQRLVDALGIDGTGHSASPGANQTEDFDIEIFAGTHTMVGSIQDGSNGGTMSYSWTTSAPFAYLALGLRPAVSAGATVTFDAVVAGVGAITVDVVRQREIIPVVAGVGAIAVALARNRDMAAVAAGQGAVAAALARNRDMAAVVAGQGAITAPLERLRALAVDPVAGLGVIAPVPLERIRSLATVVAGLGTIVADLTVTSTGFINFAAVVSGQGSVVAQADRIRGLTVPVAGQGAISAALADTIGLAAVVAGLGTVAAPMSRTRDMGATVAGQGAVAVPMARIRSITVDPVTGLATITVAITVTGGVIKDLAATVTAVGTITVPLSVNRGLAAAVAGQGAVAVSMTETKRMVATVQGVATIVAALLSQGQRYLTTQPSTPIALVTQVEGTIALLTAVEQSIALTTQPEVPITLTPQTPGTLVLVGADEENH